MNIQNLKTRFLLLVFMLLLNTNSLKIGAGVDIQTKLLSKLNNTWPELVTNDNLSPETKITDDSDILVKTMAEIVKEVNTD